MAVQPVQGQDMSELRKAAQALVDRWDTPLWKEAPHTGTFIDALRAALAQPEPEPVAWMYEYTNPLRERGLGFYETSDHEAVSVPLYAAPPQRNALPLTDDEIKCIKPVCADFVSFRAGVRQAEREHGIGFYS